MTVEELRARVEVKETGEFWGQRYRITPRLLLHPFGDGRQLVALESFDTRPAFYVVMADSGWSLSNYETGKEAFVEHVGEILNEIEEQFGECQGDDCDACGGDICAFPILVDTTAAYSWGTYRMDGWTGPEVTP